MVENNDNIQKRDKDNKKTCRRRNERKQGTSYTLGRGLQQENRSKRSKKMQRQSGKCRGEENDAMDLRKSMGGIEREQTRGRRRSMDLYR
jgi:hypothetical protein